MNKSIKQLVKEKSQTPFNKGVKLSPLLLTTLQLLFLIFLLMCSFSNVAAEIENKIPIEMNKVNTIKSYSRGQAVSSNTEVTQEQLASVNESVQSKTIAVTTTRDEVIKQKQEEISLPFIMPRSATNNTNHLPSYENWQYSSFIIYDAYTQLIEDFDGDGYYQTFSVTFDADLISANSYDNAIVYAELYLSENGGPWMHYYTTDSFIIYGESTHDEFEVYSSLAEGFNPNQYDVLIDLYEEGYTDIVATFSSDDTNNLYALPLESNDFDVEYVEYIQYYSEQHIHAGSYSILSLVVVLLFIIFRQFKAQNTLKQ